MGTAKRSHQTIDRKDLERLGDLARLDREEFFSRNPALARLYRDRILCVALCQGAALHFVDGQNGIKDFDVWTFFAGRPARRFPWRRPVTNADFGPSKFGRSPDDRGLTGRRVDFLMRGLRCDLGADPLQALRRYLAQARTSSASCLAQKAVVIIEPIQLLQSVVWPVK